MLEVDDSMSSEPRTILPVRHSDGSYPVYIYAGVLHSLGSLLLNNDVKGHIAVVSNPVVWALHGPIVETQLTMAGFTYNICMIPDGERYKTLTTLAEVYQQFLDGGLDRCGTVLSFGGGVTSDLAGFAASTYVRGIPFIQIPTTLLAMVDASVGGKTALDLPQGKNLIGTYIRPLLVVIDPNVLDTLPKEELCSGMAEVIKLSVVGDADLFRDIEDTAQEAVEWTQWIVRSLSVKIAVVEKDPFDRGQRATLKLGHTIGYALERLSRFQLRHGEAVSIGLVAAARIAVVMGRAAESLPNRLISALGRYDLPVACPPFDVASILKATRAGKKRNGQTLRWVLPSTIGDVKIVEDVPQRIVASVLRKMGAIP